MQSAGRLRFLSDSSSKRVLTEISNLVRGSNTRCRGRSFASSVPSETPRVRKIRKWVSKDERQAIVEEYINMYRSRNLGKFPTASYIKKEVGGSFYVVRKILQELEYKSKLSSSNMGNETSNKKEPTKETEGSNDFKKNMSNHITLDNKIHKDDQAIVINGMDTSDTSCMHSVVKKGPNVSVPFDKIKSLLDIDRSKSKAEDHQSSPEYSCPQKLEDVKEETPCKSMIDIDGSKSKAEEHQPPPEYPCPNKLEDVKEETPCKSMIDFDGSESKAEEHQPPLENPCPKKLEDVKEETTYESVLDIDGSKSEVEKHQSSPELENFARDLTVKQMEEKTMKKSSIWANLKSVAEGIIKIWRKR